MDRNMFVMGALVAALWFTGCGESKGLPSSDKAKADEQISASTSLQEFMTSNPSYAKASIHDIRDLADSGRSTLNGPLLERSVLDTSKAKEANALLDQVMEKTDVKSFLSAGVRIGAVMMNFAGDETFDEDMPKISCEELVENPSQAISKATNGQISVKQVEDKFAQVGQQFKKSLNDCSKISGGEFARCMVGLGKLFSVINEKVTCSIKSVDELEKSIGYSDAEKKELESSCLGAFKKCGFTMDMGLSEEEGPINEEGPMDQGN